MTRTRFCTAVLGALTIVFLLGSSPNPSSAGPGDDKHETGVGIVVKVEAGVAIDDIAAQHEVRVVETILESRRIYLLERDDGKASKKDLDDMAKRLERLDGVTYAESRISTTRFKEDSRFHAWPQGFWSDSGGDPHRWHSQANLDYMALAAVHRQATGEGVTVALLDTGVDLDHPHLVDHLGRGGYDYIDDDGRAEDAGNGVDDDGDEIIDEAYGHGTHAAGLIALVAPDAEIIVYRVLNADGRGDPHVVAEAINDAVDNGADVINMSFGLGGKHDSKVMSDALKNASRNDVVVIAAAGNLSSSSHYFPSAEKEVVGVAASRDGNGELAEFSNFGKGALVAAPGENIVSTVPGGGFGSWSGTSMATSLVSAEAALIASVEPDEDAKDLIKIIGSDTIKLNGRHKVERGLIDPRRTIEKLRGRDRHEGQSIGDSVSFRDGSPVAGVGVDLFTADEAGDRSGWLRSTVTDQRGRYNFEVDAGCYVVVFVARNGESFVGGNEYLERTTCVENGEAERWIDAVVDEEGGRLARLGGLVSDAGGGVSDVTIDLFDVNADGSRATYLGSTTTDGRGGYRFDVKASCYVVVFIAPDGRTFPPGGRYREASLCVAAGELNDSVNAHLS